MDALMIPYAINEHTTHVFPIKFFESLATGKPVIMTPLPSVSDYEDTYLASTPEEMTHHINTCLTTENTRRDPQIALAKV